MKNSLYIPLILLIIGCTKAIDDDIFADQNIEQLLVIDEEGNAIEPETEEVVFTAEELEEINGETEEPDEQEAEEEIDPTLSADNTVSAWQVFDGNTPLTEVDRIVDGSVISLEYAAGTNIANITIEFSIPETASIAQATTSLNFTQNDGVKVFDIVAENGEINTFAFEITVLE